MGPDEGARRVTSWDEYQAAYGSFVQGSYLAESVFQFYNNGGRQCYVVRVTPDDAKAANLTIQNRATTPIPGVVFTARSKGVWGNYLALTIEDGTSDPGNEIKVTVRRQEIADLLPADFLSLDPLEEHDDLSMDPGAPNYIGKVIARDSALIAVSVPATNNSLQRGKHTGGPLGLDNLGRLSSPLTAEERRFLINVDQDGYQEVTIPDAVDGGNLEAIATAIEAAVRGLTKRKQGTPDAAFGSFTCAAEADGDNRRLVLTSGTNAAVTSADDAGATTLSSVQVQNAPQMNAAGLLGLGSSNGGLSEGALAVRRPARIPDPDVHGLIGAQLGDSAVTGPIPVAPTPGDDGDLSTLDAQDYAKAFELLNDKTDFSLLAVPGIGLPTMTDLGMTYCENRPLRDVFYIGETEIATDAPAEAESFRKALTKANSYGAVYFPWVRALDPSGRSPEPILLPPSGYVAGLFARIDSTRGVWKAPAGTEASLSGVVGLATNLTDIQQGNLNRIHVNCIRRFDAAGVVSWGARTITSDPEWKYVPVRRVAIMLRRSIYDGIQWAVFEPNDERLWSSLRLNIGSFMNGLFLAGAFQGGKASDAYFVRCGLGDTMTQGDIDRGQVIVLVGFAPLKPAEFVIVRIQQKVGQA
jgi:hypothetical protein